MVSGSFTAENISTIPPARLWKASIRHAHNVIPKAMPELIASCEILEGDGGAGSIRQLTFTEAFKDFSYVKDRVDVIDDEKHVFKYTVIEGGLIGLKRLKSYSFEIHVEPTSDGGSLSKMTVEYESFDDSLLSDEEIEKIKGGVIGMVKSVEGYLKENPEAYA